MFYLISDQKLRNCSNCLMNNVRTIYQIPNCMSTIQLSGTEVNTATSNKPSHNISIIQTILKHCL